jgi:hypothetical protein
MVIKTTQDIVRDAKETIQANRQVVNIKIPISCWLT